MNSAIIIKFIVAMIVMMNPLGSLSIFLQLTQHSPLNHKQHTAIVCGFAMAIMMLITLWFGRPLLDLLGVSIASFRFAGGIILLLTGLSMLRSQETPMRHTAEEDADAALRESVAIVPMALPVIVGPGTISTLIIAAEDHANFVSKFNFSVICIILAFLMALLLYFAGPVSEAVGKSVIKVITRIMGMIVMALGVGLLAGGLIGLLPVLGTR